jgi:arabinose-5-phosphate isomerase
MAEMTRSKKKQAGTDSGGNKSSGDTSPDPNRSDELLELGREVIGLEIEGLEELHRSIGRQFSEAVELILGCTGKVIVCGIGKSGIVARKIAATLSSTGTPSVFLHSVEAAHGDMGMVTQSDIFLAVSKSGGDEEFSKLLPYLQAIGVKMIAITGNPSSRLASESDVLLIIPAGKEACPMDVVPTTSTTVSLALGDALAVAAFRKRNFGKEDFARLHPSGVLGKRLTVTVGELMHKDIEVPSVDMKTPLREALLEIVDKRLGCTAVTDRSGRLEGIITDGDLKRILIKNPDALGLPVSDLMTRSPLTTSSHILAVEALEQMEMNPKGPITQLFVVDDEGTLEGLIHIHDILHAGLK